MQRSEKGLAGDFVLLGSQRSDSMTQRKVCMNSRFFSHTDAASARLDSVLTLQGSRMWLLIVDRVFSRHGLQVWCCTIGTVSPAASETCYQLCLPLSFFFGVVQVFLGVRGGSFCKGALARNNLVKCRTRCGVGGQVKMWTSQKRCLK
ncbi:hypothetical protein IF2G_05955 [Cordyceps javanica]|nr:hypothetical protein IF2G_05955 [Cordyceps javanica]